MNNKTCFQAEKEVPTLLSMNLISGKVKNISRAYLRLIKLQKFSSVNMSRLVLIHGLLICTLISENQCLKKLRSVSNLRKIKGPAHTDFFFSLSPGFFSGLWYKSNFFSRWRPKNKFRFAGPEFFLRFEADLDFQKSRCRLKGH